jgi:hypothetical protein
VTPYDPILAPQDLSAYGKGSLLLFKHVQLQLLGVLKHSEADRRSTSRGSLLFITLFSFPLLPKSSIREWNHAIIQQLSSLITVQCVQCYYQARSATHDGLCLHGSHSPPRCRKPFMPKFNGRSPFYVLRSVLLIQLCKCSCSTGRERGAFFWCEYSPKTPSQALGLSNAQTASYLSRGIHNYYWHGTRQTTLYGRPFQRWSSTVV